MNNKISIVVPVFNESKTLGSLLIAISNQALQPLEVVFVDSGSSDDSVKIIQKFAIDNIKKFDIRTISNPRGLPGGNRNRGILAANGEWIAFLDAGIVPDVHWLENLVVSLNSGGLKAIYGQCQFDSDTVFQKAVCAISYGCGAIHPALPASLFHRSIFDSVGFFREDLRSSEDIVWLHSFEEKIGPRVVCPDALVYYRHFPQNLKQLILKCWSYECGGIHCGIISSKQVLFSFASLIVFILALTQYTLATALLLTLSIAMRGIISPIKRSNRRHWWDGMVSAPFVAIVVCFFRDAVKILARASALKILLKGLHVFPRVFTRLQNRYEPR